LHGGVRGRFSVRPILLIALLRYTRGEDGRLFNTPECAAEEIEERINSLQDEFEELCERARRPVCVTGKRRAQLAAALWPLADPATRGL
jgi:hypothetical protein